MDTTEKHKSGHLKQQPFAFAFDHFCLTITLLY